MHFGIDYGSKLAGTTVITYNEGSKLHQKYAAKGKDADKMIIGLVKELLPDALYIDAPLSLPNAYYDKGDNYFYREADVILNAMSPMFLGGLTARAMKLVVQVKEDHKIKVFETYPAALIRSDSALKENYSKKEAFKFPLFTEEIIKRIDSYQLIDSPSTIHAVDSLIAWYSGYRHQKGHAQYAGNKEEGIIIY